MSGRYLPRRVTPLAPLKVGAIRLKVYGLSAFQDGPGAELVAAARALATAHLPRLGIPDTAGFIIVHAARPAQFVLIHVWQGVDLRQLYFTSPLEDHTQFRPLGQGTVGCVWELGIVQYERNARVRTVLSRGPEAQNDYLTDLLSGEV